MRAGHGERQGRLKRCEHLLIRAQAACGLLLEALARAEDTQLQQEEFIEAQPAMRGMHQIHVVREVDLSQRIGEGHQVEAAPDLLRQKVGHIGRPRLDRLVHHRAQPVNGDPFGERIDGHEAAGVNLLAVERLELRVAHQEMAAVGVDLPAEGEGVARAQTAARHKG